MKTSSQLLRLLIAFAFCLTAFSETNLYDEIYSNPDLHEFSKLVDNNPVVTALIQHSTVTVFAPTNAAIAKHTQKWFLKNAVTYHVTNVLLEKQLFPVTQPSQLGGVPPLYLNVRESGSRVNSHQPFTRIHNKEYFVNNAKILSERLYTTKDGNKQLLYTIDELLEPYMPSTPLPPSALDFIRDPQIYAIDERFSEFFSQIESTQQKSLFEEYNGYHTFFVPMDTSNPYRYFDDYVIRAHVIPNKVVSMRMMADETYNISACSDQLVNVELSLIVVNKKSRVNSELSYSVQSNTLNCDSNNRSNRVLMSQIIRANIPVRNGVIHIISRPLMIIENTIIDFLDEQKYGSLSTFYRLINNYPEFRFEIENFGQKQF